MSNLLTVLSLTSATWYDWSIGNSATFSALCLGLHVAAPIFRQSSAGIWNRP